jgi:hypothetical protein
MLASSNGARQGYAMLIHSVPGAIKRTKIVENTRRDVEWLYVTDLTGLGRCWKNGWRLRGSRVSS